MPELPEVERTRRVLEAFAVGRRIERAAVADDRIVLGDGITPARLRRAIVGRRIVAACRRGKQLWLEFDQRPSLLLHLGMTGAIRVPDGEPLRLESGPRIGSPADLADRAAWPPRFTKLEARLDDGGRFAFTCARRLGRLRLRTDPVNEPPVCELGFDPLLDMPKRAAFADLLRRRRGNVKALLLDQTFAAGVGNWIADEVLFQARIDPRRRADSLANDEVEGLRRAIGRVVAVAVRANAEASRYPRGWLFHRRWRRDGHRQTIDGRRIERATIAGRSTAWVPDVQR